MKTLLTLTILMLSVTTSALAATPQQIIDAYRQNSAAAIEQYGGQEMAFSGKVISCTRPFDESPDLWAVWIDACDIDVVGYIRAAVPVETGQTIMLRGECAGIGDGKKVKVMLRSTEREKGK